MYIGLFLKHAEAIYSILNPLQYTITLVLAILNTILIVDQPNMEKACRIFVNEIFC